jgi:hypothetical protein
MGLLDDVYTLITRGLHYSRTESARAECKHWLHDLLFGANVAPKQEGFVYAYQQ